jgi:hypothetical protein
VTTTTGSETESQHRVIREIFQSLAEREIRVKDVYTTSPAALREKTGDDTGWLEFVTRGMASLPWYESNLPDGRTPPQPRAAVGLISLLATVLESDTIAPSSVNTTWPGGVAVEWHISGIDLEIACQPDGTVEISFEDRFGEEYEGTATEDMAQLKQFIGRLPGSRHRAG